MQGKFIIVSGAVIIQEDSLLVIKDNKDDFYKIPGGRVKEKESLSDACIREVKEEINCDIEIIKPLNPLVLWENPQTKEKMIISLIHFLAKLRDNGTIKPKSEIMELKWLSIQDIKKGKYKVSPNILFLIEKGDI